MHIGFRYHIASLVAIFFSLFIGILVGSILFQEDFLIQEQDSIIGDLELRFQDLQLRTTELQANLKNAEAKEQLMQAGWDQIREIFVSNRLDSLEILLVNISDSQIESRLVNLLELSGAQVTTSKILPNDEHHPTIIYWNSDSIPNSDLTLMEQLVEAGTKLVLLQGYGSETSIPKLLANALVIEHADLPIGELALIQGLAQDLSGIYGTTRQAVGLLPVIEFGLE